MSFSSMSRWSARDRACFELRISPFTSGSVFRYEVAALSGRERNTFSRCRVPEVLNFLHWPGRQ